MVTGAGAGRVLAAVVAVAAVAGCGTAGSAIRTPGPTPAAPRAVTPSSTASPVTDPVRIVGDWRVLRARGAVPGWESGPGGLLLVDGFAQTLIGCPPAPRASLADAARAGFRGSVLVLLDRRGTVLDRLRRA